MIHLTPSNRLQRTSPLPTTQSVVWFFARREPYYHKLQYSKTPKFDVAAAVFGVVISAFVGYLALNTLGSGGADLSDLATLFWYIFLAYRSSLLFVFLAKDSTRVFWNPALCFVRVCTALLVSSFRRFFTRDILCLHLPIFDAPLPRKAETPQGETLR